MSGGSDWAEVSAEMFREILLRSLAVREFTCPRCGAKPTFNCAYSFLGFMRTKTPHDARLTAALLVYGDDPPPTSDNVAKHAWKRAD
jgi:hypothetical protein